jgi:group I intron endonuclease
MGAVNNIYGIIYLITNKVNDKVYVGQTINLKKRMITYRQGAKNPRFYIERAIQKHGMENFEWTQIDEANNKEELDSKEVHGIAHYGANDPSVGYNCSTGGNQPRLNKESIEKMRNTLREGYATGRIVSHTKGKTFIYELTDKVLASRFKKGMTTWNKGKPWSEESSKKMSQSRTGKIRPDARTPILCVELDKVFYGINETAKIFGRSAGNLSSTLSGKQKTWGGHTWKYLTESLWENPIVQQLTPQEL